MKSYEGPVFVWVIVIDEKISITYNSRGVIEINENFFSNFKLHLLITHIVIMEIGLRKVLFIRSFLSFMIF